MTTDKPWTTAEKDIVKAALAKGVSYARIAAQLPGRTKSAVCGMVHREGYGALRPEVPRRATVKKISRRPPPACEAGPRRASRSPDRQVVVAALKPPAAVPPAPPPEALNLTLEALGPGPVRAGFRFERVPA